MIPRPQRSPLFPYTTLFRSEEFDLILPRLRRDNEVNSSSSNTRRRWRRTPCIVARKPFPRRRIAGTARRADSIDAEPISEEHTPELQTLSHVICCLHLRKTH